MSRTLAMLVLGLILGGGLGVTLAAGNGWTLDGHDHADPAHHGGATQHAAAPPGRAHDHTTPHDLPSAAAPRLDLDITADPVAGWTLHLRTDRFRFAPEHAGGPHVPGEGHAHLYINGEKRARIYGAWFHLDALPEGRAEITVSLNGNDHRPLAVEGTPVSAAVTIPPGT